MHHIKLLFCLNIKNIYNWWNDTDYMKRAYEIQETGVNGKRIINFQIGLPVRGGIRTPDFIVDELIHAAHGPWTEVSIYAGTKHGDQAYAPVRTRMKWKLRTARLYGF